MTTAQRRADASEELREAERLRDVVLRAELEARDLVHLAGLRRQDDDRHRAPFGTQVVQDLEAVALRQHHVEDDEVGSVVRASSSPVSPSSARSTT